MWLRIMVIGDLFFIVSLPLVPTIMIDYAPLGISKRRFLVHCLGTTVDKVHILFPKRRVWPLHQPCFIFSFNWNQLGWCNIIRSLIFKTKYIGRGYYKPTTHSIEYYPFLSDHQGSDTFEIPLKTDKQNTILWTETLTVTFMIQLSHWFHYTITPTTPLLRDRLVVRVHSGSPKKCLKIIT